jgi:hypothetical protein
MPGPFTHIYTARRVAEFLQAHVNEEFVRAQDGPLLEGQTLVPDGLMLDPKRCADAMNAWPKFTALGAIGPDIFFFMQDYANPAIPCDELMLAMSLLYYLDDQGRLDDPYDGLLLILAEVSDETARVLRLIIKLERAWQAFVKVLQDTIGPILDKAGEIIDDLTGGLLSALGDAFTQLKNALLTIAGEELVTSGDILSWFSLKMREGVDEQAFLWSDMLHYRRTSVVPQRLVHYAREMSASQDDTVREHGEQLLAFALGWICHVGTDTAAHPFINEQVGGPFRTHWQRHHVVENHLDAYNYERTGDGTLPVDPFIGKIASYPSLNTSALYFAVQIPQGIDDLPADERSGDLRQPLPDGDDRASQEQRDELLDTDGALPDWLAEVIVRTLVDVYAAPAEGGDASLQEEAGVPHPRNLLGQAFQDGLGDGASVLGRWLEALGIDNADMAFGDLRRAIAPDTPAGLSVPPGFPLPWELQATYRFLLSWFKRNYVTQFDMAKPKRPTVFTPPASDFAVGPPDFSGVNPADGPLAEACEVVAALLDWLFKSLEKAAQLAYDLAKSAASAATMPARAALYYGLTLPAWQVAENVRKVLTHLGYLIPQSEERYGDGELRKPSEIDLELIILGHTVDGAFAAALAGAYDVLGHLDADPALTADFIRNPKSADYPWLPVRLTGRHDVVEFRRPWAFPDRSNDADPQKAGNTIETSRAVSGPYPREALPTLLARTDGPASNRGRYDYERAGCPEATDKLNEALIGHAPFTAGYPGEHPEGDDGFSGSNALGDPVVFSAYLIGQVLNNRRFAASYDLDADRGYGYLCWDWQRKDAGTASNLRGQRYPAPNVWPEGKDGKDDSGNDFWPVPAPQPVGQQPAPDYPTALRLRYFGRSCDDGGIG